MLMLFSIVIIHLKNELLTFIKIRNVDNWLRKAIYKYIQ